MSHTDPISLQDAAKHWLELTRNIMQYEGCCIWSHTDNNTMQS